MPTETNSTETRPDQHSTTKTRNNNTTVRTHTKPQTDEHVHIVFFLTRTRAESIARALNFCTATAIALVGDPMYRPLP